MRPLPSKAQIKIDRASAICDTVLKRCGNYAIEPNKATLEQIGADLGDLTNNWRSALNYALQDFMNEHIKTVLSDREFERLRRRKTDFPYTTKSIIEFDTLNGIAPIKAHFPHIYSFLESRQPYHPSFTWLAWIMELSNTDKHRDLISVDSPDIIDVATRAMRADIVGNQLIVTRRGSADVERYALPCYFRPYQMFVSKDGKWLSFRVKLQNTIMGLQRFIEDTPEKVKILLTAFYHMMEYAK